MKKFTGKLLATALVACMAIPTFSMTANAQVIEYLDPWIPTDLRTGQYQFETYDTDWEATVHPYIECLNRARKEAIAEVATMDAITDKTGYPFIKVSVDDFLNNFGQMHSYAGSDDDWDWDGWYFDSKRYAADYPDVAAQVGTKHSKLWKHYMTTGVREGKKAYRIDDGPEHHYNVIMAIADAWTPTMTDREKVVIVNNYICQTMFMWDLATMKPHPGNTGVDGGYAPTYASNFEEIMRQLGIPCITESSYKENNGINDDVAWNQVYIDGQWYIVDTFMNDMTGSDQYLLTTNHPNAYPDNYCEKNVHVYDIYTLKNSYTEADLKPGLESAFWGDKDEMMELFGGMLDQSFADSIMAEHREEAKLRE